MFKDINFKLSVISALHELGYYTKEAEKISNENDDWEEEHTPIPAVLEYYKNLEINPAYLAEIESLRPDGGDLVYQFLTIGWDGEDDQFDIRSLEGIELLVNLKKFDPISMIVAGGVDFAPLLACEKLEFANAKYMCKDEKSEEVIQKLQAKGVDLGMKAVVTKPVEEFEPLTRLKNLINKSLPLLNQVKNFDEFHQFCVDFYAESGLERPINISLGTKNSAAITTLKKYPYPADFIEWHEKFGNTNLFLEAIEIIPTISISNNLEGYAKVLTANNYLLMTIDTSGYLYVYNVNIPEHPQLMVLRQSSYYPADKLGEFYSELLNFKYDESTQEINNPNKLDETEAIDENKKFKLTSSYIKNYLDTELEYVEGDTFLQFLIARTKEGFEKINSRYLYLNDFLKNELNPDWKTCHNEGLKYAKEGKIDLAFKEFQKAIQIHPNPASYTSLGQMYAKLGNPEMAILNYKQAIELKPNYSIAYNNLAFLYYKLNRFQEANETIAPATRLEPEKGVYHLTKAEIAFAMKDLEACYTALEKAALVKSDPKGVEAIIEKTLGKEQRYKDIIKLYKDTLKAAEKNKQDFLKKLKSSNKKTKELILELQEDDKQSDVWRKLGMELIDLKDYKNAVLAFSAGEEISPTNYYILINKGVAYHLKGDLELAKKSYLRGILFHPNQSRLWYKIATIYFKEKEAQKGFDAMQKAIELTPEESYYYPMIAYNAVLYGNLPLGLQYSKAGIRRGNASNSYLNLGHIHLINQEPEQAVLCYARSYFGFKKPSLFWGDYKSDFEVMPQYNISRATYDALIPLIEKRIEDGLITIEDFSAFWSRGINSSTEEVFDATMRAKFEEWGYPKVFLDWLELGNHNYSSEVISGDIDGFMFNIFHGKEIAEINDILDNKILLDNDYLIFATYNASEYYVFDKQNNNQVFRIQSNDFLDRLPSIQHIYAILSRSKSQAEFDKDPSLKYEDKAQTILRVKSPYIRAYIQKYLFLEKGKRYENFMDFIQDKSKTVIDYLAKEDPTLRIKINPVLHEKEEKNTAAPLFVKIEDPHFLKFLQTKKFRSALCNEKGVKNGIGPFIDPKAEAVLNKTELSIRKPIDEKTNSDMNTWIRNLNGVEVFVNVTSIACVGIGLENLDKLPPNLEKLNASINKFKTSPKWPNTLRWLDISNNVGIDLSDLPTSLEFLDCRFCELKSLPKLPSSLKELNCSDNEITALPNLPKGLLILNCSSNKLSEKPSHPKAKIDFSKNKITKIKAPKNADETSLFAGTEDDNFYLKLALVNELFKTNPQMKEDIHQLIDKSDIRLDMSVFGLIWNVKNYIANLNIPMATLEAMTEITISRDNKINLLLNPEMWQGTDDYDIVTFDGIEALKNLTSLYIDDALDAEISWEPLLKLKHLKNLYLGEDALAMLENNTKQYARLERFIKPYPYQFSLEGVYALLESDDLQHVLTGMEKLKENPNYQAEAEKRYLHFIQARLNKTDVGLEQLAEARLNMKEKALLTGRDIKDTYISLSYFDDSECKLVVDFIGSMVKNHLCIDDYIKEVKACKNENELEVIYNSYCTSCYNGIAREMALYPNCPYSKIAHHLLELDLRKVMFEKTDFAMANRSMVLKEFIFFLNLRNNAPVYLDIYQSDIPNLTEMFWLLPSIPETNWGDTTVTFPKSPLSFKRTAFYKTSDMGDWMEMER